MIAQQGSGLGAPEWDLHNTHGPPVLTRDVRGTGHPRRAHNGHASSELRDAGERGLTPPLGLQAEEGVGVIVSSSGGHDTRLSHDARPFLLLGVWQTVAVSSPSPRFSNGLLLQQRCICLLPLVGGACNRSQLGTTFEVSPPHSADTPCVGRDPWVRLLLCCFDNVSRWLLCMSWLAFRCCETDALAEGCVLQRGSSRTAGVRLRRTTLATGWHKELITDTLQRERMRRPLLARNAPLTKRGRTSAAWWRSNTLVTNKRAITSKEGSDANALGILLSNSSNVPPGAGLRLLIRCQRHLPPASRWYRDMLMTMPDLSVLWVT